MYCFAFGRTGTVTKCAHGFLCGRKVDVRLPGKGNSNSHGARPVHQIISMMKWISTSRLAIEKKLSARRLIKALTRLK